MTGLKRLSLSRNTLSLPLPLVYYRCLQIGKSKAIPLQALTGPEGSRRLRLAEFKAIGT
jgi:hypothetical protein